MEIVEDMTIAERALQKPHSLPFKARFHHGKAIHIFFDGGSTNGHGTGGFVIIDAGNQEVVRVG